MTFISHRVTEWQTPKGTHYTGRWNFFVPDFNKLPNSLCSQGDKWIPLVNYVLIFSAGDFSLTFATRITVKKPKTWWAFRQETIWKPVLRQQVIIFVQLGPGIQIAQNCPVVELSEIIIPVYFVYYYCMFAYQCLEKHFGPFKFWTPKNLVFVSLMVLAQAYPSR